LILAGYFTGGRLSDLARLKWSNVDLTEKSITFIQRKVEGKTSKARVKIPIHPVLEEYLLSGPISAAPGAPVFPELHDKPGAGKSGLSMAFKRIMDKAGIAAGVIREQTSSANPIVAFQAVIEALQKEGLIPKRAKQRLDSTHVLSAVRDMSALECVRETLRLGLEALEKELDAGERPEFWAHLWERYVENKLDFRSAPEVLTSKQRQSGFDAKRLLDWVEPMRGEVRYAPAVELLRVVFEQQYEVVQGEIQQNYELVGPAQPGAGRAKIPEAFRIEAFTIYIAGRQAIYPGGFKNTQCSRLEERANHRVKYRFEWSTHCHGCALISQCVGSEQRHRTIVVGDNHDLLQARRIEQKREAFKERMHQRNGIEGTISELTRAHGMRRTRYRGLAKARFQNLFIATACNIKRWLKLEGAKTDEIASYFPAEAFKKAFDRTLAAIPGVNKLLERLLQN
jgi:hypothetical protein